MASGTIFDIKKYSINDGPGIRTTVFFKGCPLSCWWCHNPEGQSRSPELMVRTNRCSGCAECVKSCPLGAIHVDGTVTTDWAACDSCGDCVEACYYDTRELSGRNITVEELMREIERDVPYFDQSHGGVTFSGGEPLLQRKILLEMLQVCRARNIHTIVDTSGYATWKAFDSIRSYVGMFLYDLKLMDDDKHRRYTGVSNKRILSNLKMLAGLGHDLLIRIPLIPRINDDDENLFRSGEFLASLPEKPSVEVMGYHDIASSKYEALGKTYRLTGLRPPSQETVQKVADILSGYGLDVKTR